MEQHPSAADVSISGKDGFESCAAELLLVRFRDVRPVFTHLVPQEGRQGHSILAESRDPKLYLTWALGFYCTGKQNKQWVPVAQTGWMKSREDKQLPAPGCKPGHCVPSPPRNNTRGGLVRAPVFSSSSISCNFAQPQYYRVYSIFHSSSEKIVNMCLSHC